MNLNPRTEFLKPIRTTERAKELGHKGGIKSGYVRKVNSLKKKCFCSLFQVITSNGSLTEKQIDKYSNEFANAKVELEELGIKTIF